jgi:probable O-glycosylation ligase (exosortase A-associated)
MRDYLLVAVVVASLPVCVVRPFVGVLMWAWISFMNPHRLAWGFARDLPVAQLVALATLLGCVFSREPKRIPRNGGVYGLVALWICLTACTLVAERIDIGGPAWIERSKILLMLFVTIMLVTSRERLKQLLLVTALSVGFYGFKGGIFAFATGGTYRVWGPEDSFLADNNAVALALCMIIPILAYMPRQVEDRRLRIFLQASALLSVVAVISTYSRGGLLGLGVIALFFVLKSQHKLLGVVALGAACIVVLALVPQDWTERMSTIETYQADASAVSRIEAWRVAWRLALDRPLLGWGPKALDNSTLYDRYCPDCVARTGVHSSYFQVLAEGGFLMFAVFIGLLGWCLLTLWQLTTQFRSSPNNRWVADYADMLQLGLIGFAVSGTFLELAFFDLVYHFIGATVVLRELSRGLVPAPAIQRRTLVVPRVYATAHTGAVVVEDGASTSRAPRAPGWQRGETEW